MSRTISPKILHNKTLPDFFSEYIFSSCLLQELELQYYYYKHKQNWSIYFIKIGLYKSSNIIIPLMSKKNLSIKN